MIILLPVLFSSGLSPHHHNLYLQWGLGSLLGLAHCILQLEELGLEVVEVVLVFEPHMMERLELLELVLDRLSENSKRVNDKCLVANKLVNSFV